MTDHAATEHVEMAPGPDHGHDHALGHDNSPEAVRKEMRKYWTVFFCLVLLTGVTVGIAQFHLPTWQAVTLALIVASIKGSLVAAFFMHLISEKKLIFAVLAITVFFFGMLMWGPWHQRHNAEKVYPNYDLNASQPAPASSDTSGTHSNAPGH